MDIILETRTHLDYLPKDHRVFQREYQNEQDRQCDVDWAIVRISKYSHNKITSFQRHAQRLSLKPYIYSVHLIAQGDDDPVVQQFWENGECTKLF